MATAFNASPVRKANTSQLQLVVAIRALRVGQDTALPQVVPLDLMQVPALCVHLVLAARASQVQADVLRVRKEHSGPRRQVMG